MNCYVFLHAALLLLVNVNFNRNFNNFSKAIFVKISFVKIFLTKESILFSLKNIFIVCFISHNFYSILKLDSWGKGCFYLSLIRFHDFPLP